MKIHFAEIFESMQGEGSQAGTPALFMRLSGCNLWSGDFEDRESGRGECAMWCDTDFRRKFAMSVEQIKTRIGMYADLCMNPLIIFTGGEPMLQLPRIEWELRNLLEEGVRVSAETNGTISCSVADMLVEHPLGHLVCSPKRLAGSSTYENIKLRRTNDLKLIHPHHDLGRITMKYDHLFIQPLAGQDDHGKHWLDASIECAKKHGARLSIQQHKFLGLR